MRTYRIAAIPGDEIRAPMIQPIHPPADIPTKFRRPFMDGSRGCR
jgi:hypothetical protein